MLWDCTTTFTSEPLSFAALTGPQGTELGPPGMCLDRWPIITKLAAREEQVAAPAGARYQVSRKTAQPLTPRVFPCNVNFESHGAGTATHLSPSQETGCRAYMATRDFWVTVHKFHPRKPRKETMCHTGVRRWTNSTGAAWTPWNIMVYILPWKGAGPPCSTCKATQQHRAGHGVSVRREEGALFRAWESCFSMCIYGCLNWTSIM